MTGRVKVYQQVLNEVQRLIKEDGYVSGDKLPSERQLAVQLNAARSSVREALRAIELLGIIETRQGEGTYLRNYQTYQTVGLLATFVLQDEQTLDELTECLELIENHVLSTTKLHDHELDKLEQIVYNEELSRQERHHQFFCVCFTANSNELLWKIWRLMQDFTDDMEGVSYEKNHYVERLKQFKTNRKNTKA